MWCLQAPVSTFCIVYLISNILYSDNLFDKNIWLLQPKTKHLAALLYSGVEPPNPISSSSSSPYAVYDAECDEYIRIFKYSNILVPKIYSHIRLYQIFLYKYIQIFVCVKFVCMNIFGHSLVIVLECKTKTNIRIFVQFSIRILIRTFVCVKKICMNIFDIHSCNFVDTNIFGHSFISKFSRMSHSASVCVLLWNEIKEIYCSIAMWTPGETFCAFQEFQTNSAPLGWWSRSHCPSRWVIGSASVKVLN